MKSNFYFRLIVFIFILTGCPLFSAENKIKIMVSTFPVYQITRNIVDEGKVFKLNLLIPANSGCPHDYMLTPQDVKIIAEADVIIVNGLGMEEFLGAPLKKANSNIKVIDSSKGVYGLIKSERGAYEHGKSDQHDELYNPHLFTSPAMVAKITKNIADEIVKIDPKGAFGYQARSASYIKRINKLADDFQALGGRIKNKRIVTEHGVFDYLARDLGLEVMATLQGHEGQEPSAAEVVSLIKTIRNKKVVAMFIGPKFPKKYSDMVAKETKIKQITIDPVAGGPADAPLDYYEKTMRENLKTIESMLGTYP